MDRKEIAYNMAQRARVFFAILDRSILKPCEGTGSITIEANNFVNIIMSELREMKQRAIAEALDVSEPFIGICECFSLSKALSCSSEPDCFIDLGNVLLRELKALELRLYEEAVIEQ